jgi:16S rRNA C967 or C1407 C5-methylase (RsmB/RsmF family)
MLQSVVEDGEQLNADIACGSCRSAQCAGPPFPPATFDRVLLDAPCSALGQRPQFTNRMRLKELRSFPRLQKKLFLAAARLGDKRFLWLQRLSCKYPIKISFFKEKDNM